MLYSFQQGLLNMPPKRDPERRLLLLPAEQIRKNPHRMRQSFPRAALSELMISIAQVGLIQPLTVREIPDGYELIAGERRLMACRLLGYREVPCIVVRVSEERSAAMAWIENVQREALNPVEEAQGVQALETGFKLDTEQLSVRLGKSKNYLDSRRRVLQQTIGRQMRPLRDGPGERYPRSFSNPAGDAHRSYREKPTAPNPAPMRIRRVPKDCRLFVNSVKSCIEQLDGTGIAATMEETRLEDGFDLVIHVRT